MAKSKKHSQLLSSNGTVIATFTPEEKYCIPLSLDQIPQHLIRATLDVEDRKFYSHIGFDFKGMVRAVFVNIRRGKMAQGASTITQQLARNLFLSGEKTWGRKVKEAIYTIQLEMKCKKEEILQMYLNEIYYGHGAYGIEAAAQTYFGKSAKQLNLGESAMLVGIPKGPSYYSPNINRQNAKKRQKQVLTMMTETGSIKKEDAILAYNCPLCFVSLHANQRIDTALYFRDYVAQIVTKQLGISLERLANEGLHVYTTLDPRIQRAAQSAINSILDEKSELETALVSIDPRNGHIKAMLGGKNYRKNQYNRALATNRQPGSSFKPIMYLAALESEKLTSASVYDSQPTLFHYDKNKKTYQPGNFSNKYFGKINMRQAIASSDNIYAVNTIMTLGIDRVIHMARSMGITSPLDPVPSLALGTSPISPLEMASAFSVIASAGKHVVPIAVLQITDATNRILFKASPAPTKSVVRSSATYIITKLMESVFEQGGTGSRVSSTIKRPVAGKTGSTDTDSWVVGFTPELATSVWVGYDKAKMITTADSRKAAPIFAKFTEKALENVPPKMFSIPEDVITTYIDPQSGKLASEKCVHKKLEMFIKGTAPTERCDSSNASLEKQEKLSEKPLKEEHQSWWRAFSRWWTD